MMDRELVEGDRGILTKKDREYLVGDIDWSNYQNAEKAENTIRHRIRNRIRRGIKDFILIDRYLASEDWDKILEEWNDFEEDIRENAHRTGEAPDFVELEQPDIKRGLDSGLRVMLNAFAEVGGKEYAVAFTEQILKDIIQTQNALNSDTFYYGSVSTEIADFEENSLNLDAAFEALKREFDREESVSGEEEYIETLNQVLDEFVGQLPDMPKGDYVALVDVLYLTGRLSKQDYQGIRKMMLAMVWNVEQSAISSAIEDWDHTRTIE